jgi:hypothetical protein
MTVFAFAASFEGLGKEVAMAVTMKKQEWKVDHSRSREMFH